MTDKELLELAAKAAGIKLTWWNQVPKNTTGADPSMNIYAFPIWNPLTDDGDALRLAVKLGLHVSQQLSYVAVMQPHGGAGSHRLQWTEQYNEDPYAATRRVIVRAAAQIGGTL